MDAEKIAAAARSAEPDLLARIAHVQTSRPDPTRQRNEHCRRIRKRLKELETLLDN
jgi:vacuolar-type H+-ATPase subunit I/STV1